MTNYHVGCGVAGIYAGILNKKGDMWLNKSDVTVEALNSVAQFLIEHEEALEFDYQDKRYRLAVHMLEDDKDD